MAKSVHNDVLDQSRGSVTLGPLAVIGTHYLRVLATYSNSEKSEIKLKIVVEF